MEESLKIFIDFWNFQIEWNKRVSNSSQIDWFNIPSKFKYIAEQTLGRSCNNQGTKVYASFDESRTDQDGFKRWISEDMNMKPGINTVVKSRKPKPKPFRCKECNDFYENCPSCGKPIYKAMEKGVDSAIVTDMLSQAWEGSYSVAVLVSSDADFIPVVEKLDHKGYKIINATWRNLGNQLAQSCWASIYLDSWISTLKQ